MEKVILFLKKNSVLSLATSKNDVPRSSIMEYHIINDSVMFATSKESIKSINLEANNKLSISVNSMPQFVTIDGTSVTPNEDEIVEFKKVIAIRHPEFSPEMVQAFAFYKIVPEIAYFNDFSSGFAPTEIIKA